MDGKAILRHWRLLVMLVGRDLKVKYRGSVLGYLWSMLNPLLFMLIISFVFRRLITGVPHYEVYVLSGILFWNLTTVGIIGSTNSLVSNAGLLRKVRVPYWLFIIVPIGAALANFALALIPYTLILLIRDVPLPPQIVLAPVVLALYAVFLAGIGAILSVANAFFRDVGHVIEPVLQLTFYATPIIYNRDNAAIPDWAGRLLGLNPFTQFVDLMRSVLLSPERFFSWNAVLFASVCALTSIVVGGFVYKRHSARLSFRL